MEIDFLGLNSPKYKLEQGNLKNPILDTAGGVEISLSLSTSSSLNFSDLQKKKWEYSACDQNPSLLVVAPPAFRPPAAAGFLYDLNDATPNLRDIISQSAETNVYIAPTCISTVGRTPTVAMARRATLARFLEKRLHRMNQARASHLMRSATTIHNKKSNDLKTR
ncbi:hypothetical protein SASPL_154658 [Salvia splendens]|uniref:Uncharacterized protein n=1 Tax=Salvia splendens TaxID=180675 RepID=A0A8X8W0F5_SALSN|nr:uncharacterized protein LOC121785830 [Salvia splendens]KAG6385777.1 hypothetical protein SASPL_154658 [Salvia splendens]